ncbi:MAG: ABC transporter permease [Treponema sp.]|nr:ABC transporter permease [Treponema sp.]
MVYIIKKAVILFLTLFLVSLAVFSAFHVIPGDPAMLILGTESSPEKLESLRTELGTDKPLLVQYANWVRGTFIGDFGVSLKYRKNVSELIHGRITLTFILGMTSFFMVAILGIPLGILSGYRKSGLIHPIINIFSMLGISIPGFFLSILIIWCFGLSLHVFIPGEYNGFKFFFPALAIALPQISVLVKYLSSSVIEEYSRPYIRTARSKGNSELRILFCHVLKNSFVSVIPLIGMITGSIFSGSIIVEQVFSISGIGRLLISSVTSRDFPLTQTIVLYIASTIVFVNFIVDVFIQLIDPRIRLRP